MPSLVKNGQIIPDAWVIAQDKSGPGEQFILPYNSTNFPSSTLGVWLDSDVDIEEVVSDIVMCPVIAVNFPVFADGRGLTIAHVLRTRFGYEGELRAIGEVTPDLTPFMLRCGFDAFVLVDDAKAQDAIRCMQSMSSDYQASAIDSEPKFRRNVCS